MIETVKRMLCDVCKQEVKEFAGSLKLAYSDCDYTGCGFPMAIKREDICIDCCRKLKKVIEKALKEIEQ